LVRPDAARLPVLGQAAAQHHPPTHGCAARAPLQDFLAEAAGLGDRLAVLLVQLPPSFAFEARPVRGFFSLWAELFPGSVVCELRHASWFTPSADRALAALRVSRAAVDPALWPQAARPGGWLGPPGDGGAAVLYHVGMGRRACTGRATSGNG
jgi:hypothetical protein